MFPIFVFIAQLTTAQVDAVKTAYKELGDTVEQHVAKDQPPKDAEKIDISPRLRSASFGHKTWLVVTPDAQKFWVEYGKSTNKPGGMYGPFPVATTGTKGGGSYGGPAGKPAPGTTPPTKAEQPK